MRRTFLVICLVLLVVPASLAQNLFDIPRDVKTRWISFENPAGAPGRGGEANQERKGAAFKPIKSGETISLAEIQGPGVIRRIWCTVAGQPDFLRGLVLRIYWDGEKRPAVEAPLQDFFGSPFARQVRFESAFFSNPEGRSFNCFIPMPFKKQARILLENQAPRDVSNFFFDLDYTIGDPLPAELAYFHARYRRENPTTPKKDFEVLPKISGKGRYLGCNVGVRAIGEYGEPFWFGEGELKVYLDDDFKLPTLVGTGTEDLVGSGWGLAEFSHLYQGCLISEKNHGVWGFYRYHVPDPIYFSKSIRVTLQQMSGGTVAQLAKLPPDKYPELVETHRVFNPTDFKDASKNTQWQNFEAPQDVCATAYWYQVLPSPDLPGIGTFSERMKDLALKSASAK